MINTQTVKVNLIRQDYTTAFTLNQGDKGVPVKIELIDDGAPYTLLKDDIVTIEWLKPNSSPFLQEGGIKYGTNSIEITTPESIAQYSGSGSFNIIISNGDVRKGTIRREYKVVPTSMKPGSVSEDVITDAITELRELSVDIANTVQNNQDLINNNQAATKTDIANVNSSLEEKASNVDLQTQKARIDSFTKLAEGSTTGDAELTDARNVSGTTYINVGGAVRAVSSGEAIQASSIVSAKTDFFKYYENLLNPTSVYTDKVWYWSLSENKIVAIDGTGNTCYNPIKLVGGVTYSFKDIRGGSVIVSLDKKTKIKEISTDAMFTGTYTPLVDCWLYPFFYTATNITNIMIVNSDTYWCMGDNIKLEYGKKYKRTIADVNLDNVLNDIDTINKNLPNKLDTQAMYGQLYNFVDLKYKIDWDLGSLSNDGTYSSSNKRICFKDIKLAETDIKVSTDYTKYRISVYTYDSATSTTIKVNSGWITSGAYTIAKGTYYMLQTGTLTENEEFTEVYNDCFNSIKFETCDNLINKLNNSKDVSKPLLYGLSPSTTRYIMHRGYSSQAPDNTVASFTLAGQEEKCWGIETDVRVLIDGVIVCLHDTELDAHTTGTGSILEKSYDDIKDVIYDADVKGLDTYPNEHIALFSDYLRICKKNGKVAVVELKPQSSIDNINKVVEMVNSFGMKNSVIYISFDESYIDRVLEVESTAVVQRLYLATDTVDYDNFNYDSIGLEIQDWGQTDDNILETNIRKLQGKGVLVSTWTTDTATTKRSLENKCVDFITTNLIN